MKKKSILPRKISIRFTDKTAEKIQELADIDEVSFSDKVRSLVDSGLNKSSEIDHEKYRHILATDKKKTQILVHSNKMMKVLFQHVFSENSEEKLNEINLETKRMIEERFSYEL